MIKFGMINQIIPKQDHHNRKIIHIDMDCFYAAVEMRDNPELANKPIAVGGVENRSVLCTCNYLARKFGVRSAMSTKIARTKCRDLIVLPVNMSKYRQVAKSIQEIFRTFTDLVEPLALDEAYLDVTENHDFHNSATLMAEEIRRQIWLKEKLTASAGVAPNKFLAKIASGWNKPNGICVISPNQVDEFVINLPVEKLFGVGKVTLEKLSRMQIKTCADIQKYTLMELVHRFGKFGQMLYYQSRGIDNRQVISNRPRKSLSVETTFLSDINNEHELLESLNKLQEKLNQRLNDTANSYKIKTQFVKVKYANFQTKTAELISDNTEYNNYKLLIAKFINGSPIRLIGIGVRFHELNNEIIINQPTLL